MKILNCIKCNYFYITWDSKFPKACKLYGFKGKNYPSLTVFQATGKQCEHFTPKKTN